MFRLNKKNCREFKKEQYDEVKKYIKDFPDDVKLFWNDDMNVDNGVLGCFSVLHSNSIFIFPMENCIYELASTIVHELTHRKQFKRDRLKYLILSLPLIREITIEVEARKAEREFEKQLKINV